MNQITLEPCPTFINFMTLLVYEASEATTKVTYRQYSHSSIILTENISFTKGIAIFRQKANLTWTKSCRNHVQPSVSSWFRSHMRVLKLKPWWYVGSIATQAKFLQKISVLLRQELFYIKKPILHEPNHVGTMSLQYLQYLAHTQGFWSYNHGDISAI